MFYPDCEADTIVGTRQQGYLVSLTERRSRLVLLGRVADRCADTVGRMMVRLLRPIRHRVLTITSDNGTEFAGHEAVARELEADFFFAHPYSAWERGTNENANGLV
ncbi:MAG: IS30 family transposase, partial [Candidatus Competibacteraceae bacterium]|nr:IS30 family transposase [Candidatus Competibacteraceae bacterium]